MDKKTQLTIELQKKLLDALRIVIAAGGALHYAAYENLMPIAQELHRIEPRQRTPSVLDLMKSLSRIVKTAEEINTRLKLRFVHDNTKDHFEDVAFGIFQCIAPLSVMPVNDIYQEAMRLSDATPNYGLLGEQVKFFNNVLDKARKSNHDALKMIQERRDVLETLNAQPILVEDNGTIKVYDIAPEREEVGE